MKNWFLSLAPRERRVLTIAAAVLAVLVLYVAVVEPLSDRRARLESGVASQQALLAWMQEVGGALEGAAPSAGGRNGDSLFALVDRSARATPLAESLQRVQPEGQQTVRVWLDGAPFDELVRWMGMLETEHGIGVTALTVERAQASGRVNARLTLERG